MSELEMLAASNHAPSEEGSLGASADRLGWVRAGIAALDARLDAHDGEVTPEERAMLITLLMSLEDAIRMLAVESISPPADTSRRLDNPLQNLRADLEDVGARVRTRVHLGPASHRPSNAMLRIAPWSAAKPVHVGHRLQTLGRALTGLGVVVSGFLLFEFGISGLAHDRAQQDLLAAFKQQISTTKLDSPTAAVAQGGPVALIHIPRINLDQVVVEGTSPEVLKKGPGHLRAAPLPGEFGNSVIAGRRTTYGAPFKNLDLLRVGDVIRATTGQGVFIYTVSSVGRVDTGRSDPLTAKLDTRLTLVTADPAYAPTGRLVAVARLAPLVGSLDDKGIPLDVAGRASVATSISELGLAGDPLGLILALVWGQLLIAAIWLAVRFSRRWPLSLRLMFATPTLLALAVLAFSNVDRLLPGTL